MDDTTKHRIIGGVILAASAAIFVPIFFKSSHHNNTAQVDKRHEFEIPSTPAQPEIALEEPAKVSEPMEPIDELADSATPKAAVAGPTEAGVELAKVDDAQTPPLQVQEPGPRQEIAAIESNPEAEAAPRAPTTPVAAVKHASRVQFVKEEKPVDVAEKVEPLPIPSPIPVKPKMAIKKSQPKTRLAKAIPKHAVVTAENVAQPHPMKLPKQIQPAKLAKATPVIHFMPTHNSKAADSWVVQCASFASNDHANELQTKLSAAGFHSYVKNGVAANGPVSRVFVGPQSNRVTAQALQTQLQAKANTKGILVNATILNS